VASAAAVLEAGADKISTSSAAFRKPEVIKEMVKELGAQRVTVALTRPQNAKLPSGYEVFMRRWSNRHRGGCIGVGQAR